MYVHIALNLDGLELNFSSRNPFLFQILPEAIVCVQLCLMYQWFAKTYSSNPNAKMYEEAAFDSVSVYLDWLWPKSWLANEKSDKNTFFAASKI